MKKKAVIFGIQGIRLTKHEKYILKIQKPWGIILFSRNIKSLNQLKALVSDIKIFSREKNYPILIDQEGGAVSRLNNIIDLTLFSQGFFGKLYNDDKKLFLECYKIYISKVCDILRNVGININTVPVLDVRRKKAHKIIGNRSFSDDPIVVKKIGKICIDLYDKNKIATVIKHIPGHGMTTVDSHHKLPIVKLRKKDLISNDFIPFRGTKSFFAMTAHVIYSNFDPIFPATHSKIIINQVIRKHIGFKGILISDDICMKALKCGLRDNATNALDAGCNLLLHCNGNINQMKELLKIVPTIDKFTEIKTSQFYRFLG